ncbi:MAG TPA: hypothetical protein VGM23_05945, partial [Armatimonadota bacterium]
MRTRVILGYLVLAALLASGASAVTTWSPVPLARWAESLTLEGSDTLKTPYGTWAEKDGVLTATGLTERWSTRLLPGDRGAAQRITLRFTVQQSSAAPRSLPGGCSRWNFYWGENYPGWDAGVVLRYADPLNFYRVMISATRGEMALWDSTGGFLQIVPCPVKVGEAHTLSITADGPAFTAQLDGKTVMDYTDRTLPHQRGQVGLAVWKSAVQVTQFTAETLKRGVVRIAPHTPNFHFDTTNGMVLFDGNEPISHYWKFRDGEPSMGGMLFHEAVKLKPGWRPDYYTALGPAINGDCLALVGKLPEAFKIEGGGETISYSFQLDNPKYGHADLTCTVRYDAARDAYRYEYRGKFRFTGEKLSLNSFELIDPLTYNNRFPGPEVIHRWNPAGHRWLAVQGADGWQRYPMVDFLPASAEGAWGKFKSFLYPDPAACPAWEVETGWEKPKGRSIGVGLCMWGYDYHHAENGANFVVPVGAERAFAYTLTALPPAEAKSIIEKAPLIPDIAKNTKTYLPFDPSGTTFSKTTTAQDPSTTMVWDGTQDRTVGHTDKASLRIDGPGSAGVAMYQYAIEQFAKRWWVRGWYKSKGLRGRGLNLCIKYAYGNTPQDNCYLGGLGDKDWTYFSFITTALTARDCTS